MLGIWMAHPRSNCPCVPGDEGATVDTGAWIVRPTVVDGGHRRKECKVYFQSTWSAHLRRPRKGWTVTGRKDGVWVCVFRRWPDNGPLVFLGLLFQSPYENEIGFLVHHWETASGIGEWL